MRQAKYQFISFDMNTHYGEHMTKFNKVAKFCIIHGFNFHYDQFSKELQIVYYYEEAREKQIYDFARKMKLEKRSDFETSSCGFWLS